MTTYYIKVYAERVIRIEGKSLLDARLKIKKGLAFNERIVAAQSEEEVTRRLKEGLIK